MEHVAEVVREWEDDPAMVTFGLLHTPEHTITGVIIVVGKAGIVLLDAKSSAPRDRVALGESMSVRCEA